MLGAMDEDLTPLGELLEKARLAQRPKLSQNAVAKAADTSSTTYRRIIRGVSRFGGQDVPFDGSADTVASIARVLGVTPEQLEEVGRGDAADELRELLETARTEMARRGQVKMTARGTASFDEGAGEDDDDEKLQRATQLLAEGMALLEEIRRARREGA